MLPDTTKTCNKEQLLHFGNCINGPEIGFSLIHYNYSSRLEERLFQLSRKRILNQAFAGLITLACVALSASASNAADLNGRLIPGLTTSWTAIDPLTWEFKLRQGAVV